MGPLALEAWQRSGGTLGLALAATDTAHFFMSDALEAALADMADAEFQRGGFIYEYRLPAPVVVVEIEKTTAFFVFEQSEPAGSILSGEIRVTCWTRAKGFHPICTVRRGLSHKAVSLEPAGEVLAKHGLNHEKMALLHDIFFSILGEPRLVSLKDPPRAERRRAQKALQGRPLPNTWKQVVWTLGKPESPRKAAEKETRRGVPLHFVRAHWMRSTEGSERSVQRPGLPGWWTWRSHHFRGDPAYGVQLHRYQPKWDDRHSGAVASQVLQSKDLLLPATLRKET